MHAADFMVIIKIPVVLKILENIQEYSKRGTEVSLLGNIFSLPYFVIFDKKTFISDSMLFSKL